jgi:hypothetical protein
MSDPETNTDVGKSAAEPVVQPDFASAMVLLTIASDPQASLARLKEIQFATGELERLRAELLEARKTFDEEVEADREARAKEWEKIRKSTLALHRAKSEFEETRKTLLKMAQTNAPPRRTELLGGTCVREWTQDDYEESFVDETRPATRTEPVPSFGTETSRTEPVPGAPGLTRTIYEPARPTPTRPAQIHTPRGGGLRNG